MKTMLRVFFLTLVCCPLFSQGQCPVVNLGPDTLVCSGTATVLDVQNAGATYLWSNGSTGSQFETYFEGEYWVEVTRDGCTVKDTIYVQHGELVFADFGYNFLSSCLPVKTEFLEFSQACSGSIASWSWDFGDGSSSTEKNPVHDYSAAGDYTVSLTVENTAGDRYTQAYTVSISGSPVPVVELGNDLVICEGAAQDLDAGNPGADYLWSTGETSGIISVMDPGKYYVTVTKDGCTAEDSIKITVVPEMMAQYTVQKLTGCLPVKMKFTDASTFCSSPITSWFWEFGDGTTSTLKNPEHAFASKAQFIVRLTVTNDQGNTTNHSKRITIDPITVSANLGADTTICIGESLTLDAANPGATYLWSTGETTRSISVDESGQYAVKIVNDGCESKDTIYVTTASAAAIKWGYETGSECLPVRVAFTDSSSVLCGQTITGWSWEFGDGNYSHEQNPVHFYSRADSFVVRLTITASGGSSFSRSKRIHVKNITQSVDLPSSVVVCQGSSIQLDAGTGAVVDGTVYSWSPAPGLNATDIRNPVLSPSMDAWYSVTVSRCMVTVKDSVWISLDSILRPVILQEGNMLKAPDASKWQWYRDGIMIGAGKSKTLRVDRQGYYTVKVFNENGCEKESPRFFFTPVSGKEDPGESIRVKCSPNPTTDVINIVLSEIPEKPARVTIVDMRGKKLFTTYIRDHVNPLRGLKLLKGLYFAEVLINNTRKVLPVLIQ